MRKVTVHRAWLALAVAGVTLASGVEAAHAAFPGANGRIAFAVEKWRLPLPCPPIPHGCEPELSRQASRRCCRTAVDGASSARFPLETTAPGSRDRPGRRTAGCWPSSRAARSRPFARTAPSCGRLPPLTNGEAQPTWSPDGRRLAFAGHTACCYWLYTVRPDGTGSAPGHRPRGSLAGLVRDGHDRVRQLQRPARQARGPEGRALHDPTRWVAAAAALWPLLGAGRKP